MQLTGMPYIAGTGRGCIHLGMSEDPTGHILVLRQTEFQPTSVLPSGYVIIDGAPFAHAMIPLLGTGVPTIFISNSQAAILPIGSDVVLDGTTGLITTDLSSQIQETQPITQSGSTTADGVEIQLRASVRDIPSVQRATHSNADAIGLVRSEFLLPTDGSMPDMNFYRREFRAMCAAAAPMPVTIRLLDVGGDKLPPWLPQLPGVGGPLGRQGVRLFDDEPVRSAVRAQLAAIDELSHEFDVRVLIPFLSEREEVLEWSDRVRRELTKPIPLGAMAETPSAALQIADWFGLVDFVALGCNDLMQCLFGADRDQPGLQPYLDPYVPSLFRFLHQVAVAAADHLQQLQLCGVLSQLPGILPVLLGLGFRSFSVEVTSLPYLRQTIAASSIEPARELAEAVCAAHDSTQVRHLLFPGQP